ncbi:GNAT family N-acetyltransferase [Prolixibacteraceae bacterium Z1-6]|uniref:GNAT family N-acetyltransferase n=1 Tax=Draconibacterium aestuarii TaxID=2998507 RepID=A0A9X3F5N6_9BACT|nr:GNAT family N-acetyltransferase [Prolixibacteraceae bacterium Z1-6]
MTILLRKVEAKDSRYLFELANDALTRSNSFNTKEITWEEHQIWLGAKLNDAKSFLYIFSDEDINIGTVKIERKETETIIGVTVDSTFRGKGLGSILIKMACSEFWKQNKDDIKAYIKKTNTGSVRTFEKAGFSSFGELRINDEDCIILNALR